jgi:hypothetical protein
MRDCFCRGLTSTGEGGFAYFGEHVLSVSVLRSTVYNIKTDKRGGALYSMSSSFEVDGCCFKSAITNYDCGDVLVSNHVDSIFNATSSSCVSCGPARLHRAMILIDKDTPFTCAYLNFSECRLPPGTGTAETGRGFVFYAWENGWNPWYLRMGGMTSLDRQWSGTPRLLTEISAQVDPLVLDQVWAPGTLHGTPREVLQASVT